MQRVKRWYVPVVTTLNFLAAASLVGYILFTLIGWRVSVGTGGLPLAAEIEYLTPVETVTATGIGAEVVTITLDRGIWVGELDINTEDYDGVRLDTSGDGRYSSFRWNGARDVIVVGSEPRARVYPGEVQVETAAVPGYKWTVTFVRYEAR